MKPAVTEAIAAFAEVENAPASRKPDGHFLIDGSSFLATFI